MMSIVSRLAPVLMLCALAACAKPTPYQPAVKGKNGYIDRAIEQDRVLVSFLGNEATPRAVVESSLLHRAAEVTLERGGDYFIILARDVERGGDLVTYGTNVGIVFGGGFASGFGHGPFGRGAFYGADFGGPLYAADIPRYSATAEILVRSGETPADDPFAFDARDVIANVGPSLRRPKTRG